MHYSFFIHSSVDGHLGRFHVLAIVNSAAVNNGYMCLFESSPPYFYREEIFLSLDIMSYS